MYFVKKKLKFPNFVNENRLTYIVWSKITTTVFCENYLSGSWNTGHGNNISYYCIKYTVLYCNTLKFQNQFSLFYMCSSSTVQHYNSSSMGLSSDILPNIEHYSLDKNVFFSSRFTSITFHPTVQFAWKPLTRYLFIPNDIISAISLYNLSLV